MNGLNQITVPVHVRYMVRSFGPYFLVFYLFRSVVQNFGPNLFRPVRGPEIVFSIKSCYSMKNTAK